MLIFTFWLQVEHIGTEMMAFDAMRFLQNCPFLRHSNLAFYLWKITKIDFYTIFRRFLVYYSWFTILIAEFRGTEARMIVPCSPLELSTGDGFNHIPTLIPRQGRSLRICSQLAIIGTIGARRVGWLNIKEVYMGWYPASLVYRLQCLLAITPG